MPYFHVVFTGPEPIAFQNKRVVYDILFHTLRTVAADSRPTWVTRSASSRSYTPGGRRWYIIHTYTASSPAVVSRTVSTESPFLPVRGSRAYSGDCFSRACNMPSTPEGRDSSQR
ncbi:protein of unknown function (plasmid) [Cupriavidus taiwanensis]|uniref:Transposase n=1 Tax=Cupriavidus taiwanensis TaxID=164546 RepID=A0A375I7F3_9BURK|nr:hypothetical protein CT19425_U340024 [Cupriavidus taiwanensis]SPK74821.1 protein of unknown function [Cupriavidus taiwanensis]